MASAPTRFINGLSTARKGTPWGDFIEPNPGAIHKYFNDWSHYTAGDWSITTTAGSNALASGNGGVIALTTAAVNNDIQHIAKNPAMFAFTSGNRVWFSARLHTTDITDSTVIAGLQTGGTAFAPTDGVYFFKDDLTAVWTLKLTASSTTTTLTFPTTANAVNSTYQTLSFYYDGKPIPKLYGWIDTDSAPDGNDDTGTLVGMVSTSTMTNLPSAVLSQAMGIRAGAAAAKVLRCDFLFVANEITR